jgi:uncharacterized protein (UPF0332 family)
MNYDKLLADYKIRKVEPKEFDLSLAERDLESAKHSFDSEDFDWALSIAYNAALQAGRSLMFHLGYKPSSGEPHRAVFEFLKAAGFDPEQTDYFDRIRKTRHTAIYDAVDAVSRDTASEVLAEATIFVQKIRTFVQEIRTDKGETPPVEFKNKKPEEHL